MGKKACIAGHAHPAVARALALETMVLHGTKHKVGCGQVVGREQTLPEGQIKVPQAQRHKACRTGLGNLQPHGSDSLGIVVQGSSGFRGRGNLVPLFDEIPGSLGKASAHVLPAQPDIVPIAPQPDKLLFNATGWRGQDKLGPVLDANSGQGQKNVLGACAYVQAQYGPGFCQAGLKKRFRLCLFHDVLQGGVIL